MKDLSYIEQLLIVLKELEYNDLTVQDLKEFHDDMVNIGLLPDEMSEAHFVDSMIEATGIFGVAAAKYDAGYGVKTDMWADKGDVFNVSYLVYNDSGEKLEIKEPSEGKIKLSDALSEADRIKKNYDAYKVIITEKLSGQMLAKVTTKGPKKLEVNLPVAGLLD